MSELAEIMTRRAEEREARERAVILMPDVAAMLQKIFCRRTRSSWGLTWCRWPG